VSLPPAPSTLPWHHRLEARVLASVTLVAGISLLAVLMATGRVVKQYSLDRSTEALAAAREAFTRQVATRTDSAHKTVQLIAQLPVFQDTVAFTRDLSTVSVMARDYCRILGADFCVVSDPLGEWIGRTRTPAAAERTAALQRLIQAAHAGHSATGFVTLDDGLFLVVSEPVRVADEILATFSAAYGLDDAVARDLATVTQCDVTFVCARGRLCGSSLPSASRTGLTAILAGSAPSLGAVDAPPTLRAVGPTFYVGGMYTLGTGVTSDARLVLLQDWTLTERALGRNRTQVLVVSLVVFGVAFAGALFFSRRLSRPLRDLAIAARDIARGEWARRVPVAGVTEARQMAEAFNSMTATLSHWHEQAERRAQELREASDRFRSVTDSATDAIVSITTRGVVVFWNLRAEAMFGYAERDVLGRTIDLIVPERLQEEYARELTRLAAGDREWIGGPVEVYGRRRDGNEVPLELSISTWKAGADVFYTGVIRDITDRRQAAEALQHREEQLRQAQKMEAVGQLAGGVAHDFNNLLTAILGCSELLLRKLPSDLPARAEVVEIQKAGRSAASLTRDLLAFSRKQVLQPVVIDLNDVVSGAENLLRRLLGETINLAIELDPSLPPVQADPGQLEQVLMNLAVNARDAMPSGGRLRIATGHSMFCPPDAGAAAASAGPQVTLRVSDSGVGMTDDVRSRIFEPFFTTKEVGSGTGLGLAMVYGIVTQSGGHIWVDSAPGRGATFTVSLPATSRPVERVDPSPEPITAGPRGSETVLLVEDNDAVRRMAREALHRFGYRVVEARNGEAALGVVADNLDRIAIVLTDVVMPLMGGRELAARLRARRPDLKIIFTSGYANDTVVGQSVLELGAMFIQKPFSPAQLGRTVRAALDAKAPESTLSRPGLNARRLSRTKRTSTRIKA
jgi:PAS domain S-box-containing protein